MKLAETWQVPLHLVGGGPNPVSLKLSDSGQIPVSITPIITSLSVVDLSTFWENPMKSHDLVVCSFNFLFGNTETTPLIPELYKIMNNSEDFQVLTFGFRSHSIIAVLINSIDAYND